MQAQGRGGAAKSLEALHGPYREVYGAGTTPAGAARYGLSVTSWIVSSLMRKPRTTGPSRSVKEQIR